MDEDTANALLKDIDFHYNKLKCPKIEGKLSKLMKIWCREKKSFSQRGYH